MYLDNKRPRWDLIGFPPALPVDTVYTFETPVNTSACSWYHSWGWGLKYPNTYTAAALNNDAVNKLRTRAISFLVGGNDICNEMYNYTTNCDDGGLSTSCGSMWQGPERRARSVAYYQHIRHYYGDDSRLPFAHSIVDGVGHSSTGLLTSTIGQAYAFTWLPPSNDDDDDDINSGDDDDGDVDMLMVGGAALGVSVVVVAAVMCVIRNPKKKVSSPANMRFM